MKGERVRGDIAREAYEYLGQTVLVEAQQRLKRVDLQIETLVAATMRRDTAQREPINQLGAMVEAVKQRLELGTAGSETSIRGYVAAM